MKLRSKASSFIVSLVALASVGPVPALAARADCWECKTSPWGQTCGPSKNVFGAGCWVRCDPRTGSCGCEVKPGPCIPNPRLGLQPF